MIENFIFYGIFLDESSKNLITSEISKIIDINSINTTNQVYLDHCTVIHYSQQSSNKNTLDYCKLMEGAKLFGRVTHIGWSNDALAVRCEFPGVPIVNRIPHITVATFDGAKPTKSDNIFNWHAVSHPIEISGVLKSVRPIFYN